MTPTQAPTASELLNDPIVQQALAAAWNDSEADDPAHRHEEGGWIYMDLRTGRLVTQRAIRGAASGIDLCRPPLVSESLIVGKFHTHPNPTVEGWDPGPSGQDRVIDARHGVPDLIRADTGTYCSGPSSRRGGLSGGPGFPP